VIENAGKCKYENHRQRQNDEREKDAQELKIHGIKTDLFI
jgi:hypothetical protein